jgi:hypothetical protein
MINEAPHRTESCWTTEHSLRNCAGYQVYESDAWLGYVDAVLFDAEDEIHSLLVHAGGVFLAVPLGAVLAIDAAGERIDLKARQDARAHSTREDWL